MLRNNDQSVELVKFQSVERWLLFAFVIGKDLIPRVLYNRLPYFVNLCREETFSINYRRGLDAEYASR